MSKRYLKEFTDENLRKEFNVSQDRLDTLKNEAYDELDILRAYKKDIFDELIKYKEQEKLSIRDLKDRLGTSSISQVQKLLNGTANITADTVVKIAQAIGKKPHVVWK